MIRVIKKKNVSLRKRPSDYISKINTQQVKQRGNVFIS